jgi:hypothetical protein
MKYLAIFLFVFIAYQGVGQSLSFADKKANESSVEKLLFADSLSQVIRLAKKDIASGAPYLLLRSGISPIVYPSDSIFEQSYKIRYFEWGCTGPDQELLLAYNQVIFSYLEKESGRKWEHAIRKDVIGYKAWKKKRRQQ